MFDYKEEIRIDPFALDEECLDQGRKYLEMAQIYADSVKLRDQAKLRVEVVFSNLAMQVRRNPSVFDLKDKPSDATVTAVVTIQKGYIKARHRLARLNRECEFLKPGVDAFKGRSIDIGRLIQLHLSGYFGQVRLPANAEEAIDNTRTAHQRELLSKNERLQKFSRRNQQE